MPLNVLLRAQEMILNRFLHLDPELDFALSKLVGKVVKLELGSLSHYWVFKPKVISLIKEHNGMVDLILSGSIFDFMRLPFMKKDKAITAIPVHVSGDMEFAKQFRDLFANLEIDWEEQLANLLGDTFAFPVALFLKNISHWSKQSFENINENIRDYIQIEMAWLVSNEELQIFFAEVDVLRDEAARLKARLKYLQRETE
jgi:ubiquinone biosynthesis accessory factor UbiJ